MNLKKNKLSLHCSSCNVNTNVFILISTPLKSVPFNLDGNWNPLLRFYGTPTGRSRHWNFYRDSITFQVPDGITGDSLGPPETLIHHWNMMQRGLRLAPQWGEHLKGNPLREFERDPLNINRVDDKTCPFSMAPTFPVCSLYRPPSPLMLHT